MGTLFIANRECTPTQVGNPCIESTAFIERPSCAYLPA